MTTEYHDDPEEDSTFWNQEPPGSFSRPFRIRRWMFPALTATVVLILIIALGASSTGISNRLWFMEESVLNLTASLSSSQQLTNEAAKDVHRLKFAVESNRDQLTSVGEALKDLSTLDSLSRTVANLKCSLERIINNGSTTDGCCALNWDPFGKSCYFFSNVAMTWDEAQDWCTGHESHLVILTTDKEWDFVVKHSAGTWYWVGLTDRTGKWEWVNHTPYVMDRRRWRPGQPDSWTGHGLGHGDEDCGQLHTDGRLNDLHCLTQLRYICQKHS
ncbi:asialoglycoprotein receptor 1 isoform X1 [Takifugu flavidus]|uniref:C-type lectin domain family 10 member A MMGL n=1 Tax=Takifugu flavidus TaxID=433684 RepID=A0A5C6N7T3_9TELE|nr:asialoglycoprotein receptor 1 isoform X1 [Takifugu flavidus]TWW63203.1 C-type lectin domain family 10 member A MMGL [Takifugu flavidus]